MLLRCAVPKGIDVFAKQPGIWRYAVELRARRSQGVVLPLVNRRVARVQSRSVASKKSPSFRPDPCPYLLPKPTLGLAGLPGSTAR